MRITGQLLPQNRNFHHHKWQRARLESCPCRPQPSQDPTRPWGSFLLQKGAAPQLPSPSRESDSIQEMQLASHHCSKQDMWSPRACQTAPTCWTPLPTPAPSLQAQRLRPRLTSKDWEVPPHSWGHLLLPPGRKQGLPKARSCGRTSCHLGC